MKVLKTKDVEDVIIYPTHIEVHLNLNQLEFENRFKCRGFCKNFGYISRVIVIPTQTSEKDQKTLLEIQPHERNHVLMNLVKENPNYVK